MFHDSDDEDADDDEGDDDDGDVCMRVLELILARGGELCLLLQPLE